ncbi:MAG: hypothetical protein WD638_14175 [Nitriliruptoraceae bacterium]
MTELGEGKSDALLASLEKDGVVVFESTVEMGCRVQRNGLRTAVFPASRDHLPVSDAAGLDALLEAPVDGVTAAEPGFPGSPDPAPGRRAGSHRGGRGRPDRDPGRSPGGYRPQVIAHKHQRACPFGRSTGCPGRQWFSGGPRDWVAAVPIPPSGQGTSTMRRLEKGHGTVIDYSLSGEVTADEHTQLASELRDEIAEHGTIRVLFWLSDLELSSSRPSPSTTSRRPGPGSSEHDPPPTDRAALAI